MAKCHIYPGSELRYAEWLSATYLWAPVYGDSQISYLWAYRIYIPSLRQIEISGNVTFDEDREEHKAPLDAVMRNSTPAYPIREEQDETVEPEVQVDPPNEIAATKKRPTWLWNTLKEA